MQINIPKYGQYSRSRCTNLQPLQIIKRRKCMYIVWRVKQKTKEQRQKSKNSLRICKSANNKSIITLIIRNTKGNSSELSPRRGNNARRARDAWRATTLVGAQRHKIIKLRAARRSCFISPSRSLEGIFNANLINLHNLTSRNLI